MEREHMNLYYIFYKAINHVESSDKSVCKEPTMISSQGSTGEMNTIHFRYPITLIGLNA